MTIEKQMKELEMGLTCANHRNRRLITAVLVNFSLLIVVMVAGLSSNKDVIRAKSFILVDDSGKSRAIQCIINDEPTLRMFDKKDKLRICLIVDEFGSIIALKDENSTTRAILGISGQKPILSLNNENDNPSIVLAVAENEPSLNLSDKNDTPRAILSIVDDRVGLSMWDMKGKLIWSVP